MRATRRDELVCLPRLQLLGTVLPVAKHLPIEVVHHALGVLVARLLFGLWRRGHGQEGLLRFDLDLDLQLLPGLGVWLLRRGHLPPNHRVAQHAQRPQLVNLLTGPTVLGHDVVGDVNRAYTANPTAHRCAVRLPEPLLSDGAGRHAPDRLPCRGAAAARGGARAHFDLVSEICVSWAWHRVHFLVVAGALVLVHHDQAYRCAEGVAALGAGEDCHEVLFVAGRRQPALARPPARQLRLDVRFRELHAWGHPIYDCANGLAVRFAEGRDPENAAERRHGA
mmetsp:Transcript_81215/g.226084  ORF Transcript_81215/g.226084 Transcript_81215/m.226084 type:complete len:280 (-) Transcript_81215:65-904(-)